ncbi:hypothetical protein C8A05DRAFT_43774 [Staphylotrichum tortipilum]|uniref:Uncharacterized protein n=1 Tax=Staphylotrichum tortipilum TaxID=2831512 RepID=A0AAN6RTY5_9PEZI|nr:hypothetical protein C8A05DRAFT_43774 [Staphylotrichum longicolle]
MTMRFGFEPRAFMMRPWKLGGAGFGFPAVAGRLRRWTHWGEMVVVRVTVKKLRGTRYWLPCLIYGVKMAASPPPAPSSPLTALEDQKAMLGIRGLLLSCRTIYAEAAALLYSANRFVVHYTGAGTLAPLLSLTAPALSSLGSLKIVLNQASCHLRPRYHGHQVPLLASLTPADADGGNDTATQTLLGEWDTAARHLSVITSGSLELALVCDISPLHEQAVQVAASVLAPLGQFPLLRSCHIRLAATPDLGLGQLAQCSTLESRGLAAPKPTTTKGSAFLALPRELRLCILEFTDLVTPNHEVCWCRQDSKYTWSDLGGDYQCNNDTFRSPCAFSECWYRSTPIGCFCRRRHAASSTACICWVPPGPVFLVCRTLYQDAQLVFFSSNRFIVHDLALIPWALDCPRVDETLKDECGNLNSEYPFPRLAASQFLRDMVPAHCIPYLRFLELVFPPYLTATWPKADHPVILDWHDTILWLQDRINGPALTIRLVAAKCGTLAPDRPYTDTISVAFGDAISAGYAQLLQPIARLGRSATNGLARFYADLRYPWEWTDEATQREDRRQWAEAGKREVKSSTERRVLRDRYASQYANGKEEPEVSLWQHVFAYHY